MTTCLSYQEINELNGVAAILAQGLAAGSHSFDGLPLDVTNSLIEARNQMESLPEVIQTLQAALFSYQSVSSAIERIIELAETASASELSSAKRESLNTEFVDLAKIVAADAGRSYYAGPRLNLLSQSEAKSAARIMSCMKPVISETGRNLAEQRDLIYNAIAQTINFLVLLGELYPDREDVRGLVRLAHQVCGQSCFKAQPVAESMN